MHNTPERKLEKLHFSNNLSRMLICFVLFFVVGNQRMHGT